MNTHMHIHVYIPVCVSVCIYTRITYLTLSDLVDATALSEPNLYKNRYIYSNAAAKSLHSCPTLCDPIDGSPPGSPVPGILQARTMEWVAISFSNAGK